MWNRIPDTEPVGMLTTEAAEYDPADLIPLSHLSLDLDAPIGGWDAALAARGVQVHTDDLGRRCIRRTDARVLFAERAESEARQREAAERQARQAAELDQQWRAQLGGVPSDQIPQGVLPATAMLQAAKDAAPRRRTVLEEALDNDGLTYHPVRDDES